MNSPRPPRKQVRNGGPGPERRRSHSDRGSVSRRDVTNQDAQSSSDAGTPHSFPTQHATRNTSPPFPLSRLPLFDFNTAMLASILDLLMGNFWGLASIFWIAGTIFQIWMLIDAIRR